MDDLGQRLARLLELRSARSTPVELSPEEVGRLRSLGYLQ